jgi:hypothetical protein
MFFFFNFRIISYIIGALHVSTDMDHQVIRKLLYFHQLI